MLIDFLTLFHHVLRNLRTLYIVWSLVKRRVTRHLTRLQTMCNVLKYRKIFKNGSVRLRCGCGYFFNLLKTSTVCQVYKLSKNFSRALYAQLFFCFTFAVRTSELKKSFVDEKLSTTFVFAHHISTVLNFNTLNKKIAGTKPQQYRIN